MKTDWRCLFPNWYACRWTVADLSPAVFKTVCGALLRRPGWVRFPSIPASFGRNDSQTDSQNHKRFSKPAAALWPFARVLYAGELILWCCVAGQNKDLSGLHRDSVQIGRHVT